VRAVRKTGELKGGPGTGVLGKGGEESNVRGVIGICGSPTMRRRKPCSGVLMTVSEGDGGTLLEERV